MFTVKHYRRDGKIAVTSCNRYIVSAGAVEVSSKGAPDETIAAEMGETIFIENAAGKTVTTVRPGA